jgi:hypothetical protein
MEVIKQKLQVSKSRSDTIPLLKDTWNKYGIRGFYRGYFLGQAVFIPYTIAYFVSYEQMKLRWKAYSNSDTIPFNIYLISSSISAAIAGAISNPIDVVKCRVQVSNKRTVDILKQLYNDHGIQGFTKGLGARILWIAPSMSISVTIFELLKDHYRSIS